LNNPLLYVDPLGLWGIYYEDLYKTKKNKDATETKVFDRRGAYARKTKDDDDGASLAAQLGRTGKDAVKFAEKIGGGNNIRLADQGGDVGRVLEAVEEGLTDQVKWEAKNSGNLAELAAKGEYGARHSDCSRTACQVGLGQFLGLEKLGRMSSTLSSVPKQERFLKALHELVILFNLRRHRIRFGS
jgi:hypothetical protein